MKSTVGNGLAKEAKAFNKKKTPKEKPWGLKHLVIASIFGGLICSSRYTYKTEEAVLKEAEKLASRVKDL